MKRPCQVDFDTQGDDYSKHGKFSRNKFGTGYMAKTYNYNHMKNKWTKIILSCMMLFALCNEYCMAQTNDVFMPTIIDFYNQLKFQTAVTANEADNITGSPYLDSSFYQGFIVTVDSLVYQGVHMRYNNYKDVVEFKKKDNEIYEIPISFPIIQLKFGGDTFERKEYQSDNGGKYGFFQRILEGEISLFRQQRVILEKGKNGKFI